MGSIRSDTAGLLLTAAAPRRPRFRAPPPALQRPPPRRWLGTPSVDGLDGGLWRVGFQKRGTRLLTTSDRPLGRSGMIAAVSLRLLHVIFLSMLAAELPQPPTPAGGPAPTRRPLSEGSLSALVLAARCVDVRW